MTLCQKHPLSSLGIAFAVLVSFSSQVQAEVVRVKARTQLWVDISKEGNSLRGWLADDLGTRLAHRQVVIRSGDVFHQTRTDESGEFENAFPLGLQEQRVTIEYTGDQFLEGSTLSRVVDPSRLPVRLQLVVPTRIHLAEREVEVQVHAVLGDRPVQVPIAINQPTIEQTLASGRTDETGWAYFSFDPRRLSRPGRHLFHASFPGDARLAPALTRGETLVVDDTTLSISASSPSILQDQRLRIHGNLIGFFAALPGQEISIEGGGRVLGLGTTDNAGRYSIVLHGTDFPESTTTEITARYNSTTPSRSSCRSDPISILVQTPNPLAVGHLVVPVAVTLSLVIFVLLITRSGKRKKDEHSGRSSTLVIETGLRTSRAPSRTMRRADVFDFSGLVWDAFEECPVALATVTVATPAGTREYQSTETGHFQTDNLDKGMAHVIVEAPGYRPERFHVSIPHHGEFHNVRVSIVQVRHLALEVYRNVAIPLLPRLTLWGRWTPREIAVHTVRSYPWIGNEIAELTSFFESLYYSAAESSLKDLEEVRRLAEELMKTHTRGSPQSSSDG